VIVSKDQARGVAFDRIPYNRFQREEHAGVTAFMPGEMNASASAVEVRDKECFNRRI